MAQGLGSRLLLSYVVVIVVCLVLVTVALILIARPVQERLALARLGTELALIAPRVTTALEHGEAAAETIASLARRADRRDLRLLIVDRSGRVLGDTEGALGGTTIPGFAVDAADGGRLRGTAVAPNGTAWLYAAAPVAEGLWLVSVTARPTGNPGLFGDLGEGLVVAGFIALVFSVMLAVLIAQSVAGPTRRMAAAAEAIARGDYDVQLDIRGPKEMRLLAESMSTMAAQVEVSQQSMRDLVANVSHDLRTPLTSVMGFAQALKDGVTEDAEARERAATVICEEAGRMARLVDDLADLALIEAGQLRLVRASVDVRGVLEHVVASSSREAAEGGVNVSLEAPQGLVVAGDRDRLVQVFGNLVQNAVKYTPAGGRVAVSAGWQEETGNGEATVGRGGVRRGSGRSERDGGRGRSIVVSVADTGCGIPAADVPRVFERFYRVDRARAWRGGSGLGLAIAREIVEAHGGRIGVESVAGLGSRFSVVLPAGDLPEPITDVSRETMGMTSDKSM